MQKFLERNRWAVIVAATAMWVCTSFPSLWGVFQQSAANAYGITLAESAMMFPMCVAFFGIFSIIGGKMQDSIGPRTTAMIGSVFMAGGVVMLSVLGEGTKVIMLYLCFSLPFGGGCGLISPAINNTVMKWYADKKGFAMGLAGAVSSVCLMAMTYLSKYLLSTFGMKTTVRSYGIAFLIVSILSCMFFVNPTGEYIKEKSAISALKAAKNKKSGAKTVSADFTPSEMLKTKQYYLLFFAGLCAAPAYMLIAPSIVTIGISRGLTENQAVSAVALATGASAIGKFIVPTLSDKIGRKKCALAFTALTLIFSVVLMQATGSVILVAYAAMVFTHGGWSMLINPFANDMFGFRNAGINSGFIMFYNTLASFAGPLMVTLLTPVFAGATNHYIGIIGMALAILLLFMIDPDTAKLKEE